MATALLFGKLLLRPDRRKWILTIGICATALFFVLRGFNLYGNGIAGLPLDTQIPQALGVQSTLLSTVNFIFQRAQISALSRLPAGHSRARPDRAWITGRRQKQRVGLSRILLVYGRVPLFYYLCTSIFLTS